MPYDRPDTTSKSACAHIPGEAIAKSSRGAVETTYLCGTSVGWKTSNSNDANDAVFSKRSFDETSVAKLTATRDGIADRLAEILPLGEMIESRMEESGTFGKKAMEWGDGGDQRKMGELGLRVTRIRLAVKTEKRSIEQ
jgi:hypothetical protein